MTSKNMENVSIYIITYNEENDIKNCLDSVSWSNDIVLLDSYSTDDTTSIAKTYANTRVFQREFDNYSSQRNYGLQEIDFLNPWVFIIDADEVCTEELSHEILSIATLQDDDAIAYSVRRNTFYRDKLLKHNSLHNARVERLVKPKKILFYGNIHEKLDYDGKMGELSSRLDHFPFSKGIDYWLTRRNTYSTLSAENELISNYPISIKDIYSQNDIRRRVFLNAIYKRLPVRWLLFFLYNFFVKFCFIDGVKGMHMILLETYYEFLIVAKIDYKKD